MTQKEKDGKSNDPTIEEKQVPALYLVVKENDNELLIFHMASNQSCVLQREAAKEGIDLELPRLLEGSQSSPSCITKLAITE